MNDISTLKDQGKDVSTACIRDIFLHRKNSVKILRSYIRGKSALKIDFKEVLNIYPNMVEIRQTNDLKQSRNKGSAGKKDIIKEFSRKSRREFIKLFCKMTDKLVLWQDVTFSDDVMQNKLKRKEVSNKSLERFRRVVIEKYSAIKVAYKREWQPRKSGDLKGEHIPHFHMFMSVPDASEDYEVIDLAIELAKIWVDCTGTKEISKARRVALHPKSYRIIKNQKQAIKYATKYITKPGGNWADESIGRSWGTIGKFNIAEPDKREMTPAEMVSVKRRFRKIAPKKHPIQKALRQKESPTFLIVNENTVNRIIEHTQSQLENDCLDFFEGKGDQN
jgi:hypothetical protein